MRGIRARGREKTRASVNIPSEISKSTFAKETAIAYGVGGAAICGIGFLAYLGRKQMAEAVHAKQMSTFNPIVRRRIAETYAYFGGSLAATAAFTFLFRNVRFLRQYGEWVFPWIPAFLGSCILTIVTSYKDYWELKNFYLACFVACWGASIVPLVHRYSMPIINDAIIATGGIFSALSVVAWNSPSE